MDWWMLALGAAVIAVVTFDLLATSLSSTTRSGPLTELVTTGTWRLVSSLARREGSPALRVAGPLTVAVSIFLWLVLLWGAWTLVFAAQADAVVSSTTGVPVDLRGRSLFAAYTVYTLGYGNYLPTGAWEIVAAFGLLSGLSTATLAITYVIPVVTAVTDSRRQASLISTAGTSPEAIVRTLYVDDGFAALDELLAEVIPQILLTGQRHLTYPVMHNYRGSGRPSAFPRALGTLDDAVTMLDVAVTDGPRPNAALVTRWRRAVDQVLEFVELTGERVEQAPPLPDLAVLDELGIEHLDDAAFARAIAPHTQRRCRLHRYLIDSRWTWPVDEGSGRRY